SCIIGLYIIERLLRKRKRYSAPSGKSQPLRRRKLTGAAAAFAVAFGMAVFLFSFLIPVVQLIVWAGWTYQDVLNAAFAGMLIRTFAVSLVTIAALMLFAIIVAN